MTKYRKKPLVIDAFRVGGETPDWGREAFKDATLFYDPISGALSVRTIEGVMIAKEDDWIIRGIEGEIYPCKHSVFEATYEAVEDGDGSL